MDVVKELLGIVARKWLVVKALEPGFTRLTDFQDYRFSGFI